MGSRNLTSGEEQLAISMFKFSIDYTAVKIYDEPYIFFQPDNSGMTPNGNIYIKGMNTYKSDYSLAIPAYQAFYLHEMGHVWQYQNNILCPIISAITENLVHFFDYSKAYKYTLDPNNVQDLTEFDMEQQAAIFEDYFRVVLAGIAKHPSHLQGNLTIQQHQTALSATLSKFLINPSYAKK